jgi:general nucleoside transport system ATP-binding protein
VRDALLSASAITKVFGTKAVLQDISTAILPGRLHFICGENGAGKSTLIKVLGGVIAADRGSLTWQGGAILRHSVRHARTIGLATVHQHFALFERLTAFENCLLVAPPGLRAVAVRARMHDAMARLECTVPLDQPVATLSVGERQRLEIARAVAFEMKLLLLDEPTAVLSPVEVAPLYRALATLCAEGKAVVVITHHLSEVALHANFVTVLRQGRVVLERAHTSGADVADVAEAIMGATASTDADHEIHRAGAVAKIARDVRAPSEDLRPDPPIRAAYGGRSSPAEAAASHASVVAQPKPVLRMEDVRSGSLAFNLTIGLGESVGIAGIQGSGQRELAELCTGHRVPVSGTLQRPPRVAWVPENRQEQGLVLDANAAENVLLGSLGLVTGPPGLAGFVDDTRFEAEARARLARVAPELETRAHARVSEFSGGNQQKVVMARALAEVHAGATLLVLSEPTRGVDIGAKAALHLLIRERHAQGTSVLTLSSDLDELRHLATRIFVLSHGKLVGPFPNTATDLELGRAMLA